MCTSIQDRSGNCQPGTTIDTGVCHPVEYDYYQYSHSGIQVRKSILILPSACVYRAPECQIQSCKKDQHIASLLCKNHNCAFNQSECVFHNRKEKLQLTKP